jgi:betaine-aldehyde dehydrogenase
LDSVIFTTKWHVEACCPDKAPQPGRPVQAASIHCLQIGSDMTHFDTINPATGEVLASIRIDGPADIDAAVVKAKAAQKIWGAMTGTERGRILRRAVDILRARNDELALLETRDTGKPIQETIAVDVLSGADCIEYYANVAATIAGEHVDLGPGAFGYTRREPLGITAGIGAWNYPLQIACWKSAPALACGNAMIFKPAELTPLTAIELEKIYLEAGVPEGVFQVVQGFGATGQLLTRIPASPNFPHRRGGHGPQGHGRCCRHAQAGHARTGRQEPADRVPGCRSGQRRVGALLANFYSAGEVCSNGTRVFVHASVMDDFLARLKTRTEAMVVGDPADPATHVGALISQATWTRSWLYRAGQGRRRHPGHRRAPRHGQWLRQGRIRRPHDLCRLR